MRQCEQPFTNTSRFLDPCSTNCRTTGKPPAIGRIACSRAATGIVCGAPLPNPSTANHANRCTGATDATEIRSVTCLGRKSPPATHTIPTTGSDHMSLFHLRSSQTALLHTLPWLYHPTPVLPASSLSAIVPASFAIMRCRQTHPCNTNPNARQLGTCPTSCK